MPTPICGNEDAAIYVGPAEDSVTPPARSYCLQQTRGSRVRQTLTNSPDENVFLCFQFSGHGSSLYWVRPADLNRCVSGYLVELGNRPSALWEGDPGRGEVAFGTSTGATKSAVYLQPTFADLDEFAGYGPNWDGDDADPITAQSVQIAKELLTNVAEELGDKVASQVVPFGVRPLSDGGIQVEYRGRNASLIVNIGPSGQLDYLLITGHKPNRDFDEQHDVSWHQVIDLVRKALLS